MNWIDIGHIHDIPLPGWRLVKTRAGCIGLFRADAAEVFATSNTCAQKGGPRSEGIVYRQKVTCPLHSWVFDLNTGFAQGEEAWIETYPVQVKADRILLYASGVARRSAA